jgi:hypothetical protein
VVGRQPGHPPPCSRVHGLERARALVSREDVARVLLGTGAMG